MYINFIWICVSKILFILILLLLSYKNIKKIINIR